MACDPDFPSCNVPTWGLTPSDSYYDMNFTNVIARRQVHYLCENFSIQRMDIQGFVEGFYLIPSVFVPIPVEMNFITSLYCSVIIALNKQKSTAKTLSRCLHGWQKWLIHLPRWIINSYFRVYRIAQPHLRNSGHDIQNNSWHTDGQRGLEYRGQIEDQLHVVFGSYTLVVWDIIEVLISGICEGHDELC